MVHHDGMARSIEFDRPKALDAALEMFWCKGWQATSRAELLAEMGIGRSSFYAVFSNKRSLQIECLDRFAARTPERLCSAPAPRCCCSMFWRTSSSAT